MKELTYLDNAATSFPKPDAVYARINHILTKISGSPGRASHRMAIEAGRVVLRSREAAARLINAGDSSRVSFTKNATEGINIALKGLLHPGDRAVTSSIEHNSVVKTLATLSASLVEVVKVSTDRHGLISVREIEDAIAKDTKLLIITHASNLFGTIQPVAEIGAICRARGVIFVVDAAQSVGALPIDVQAMNIDILVATGHKACFGPQGTGFIYVRKGLELPALINGGTGELDAEIEMPERFESGTMNTPGIGGLGAGIEFVLAEGIEKIRGREESLSGRLIAGLASIDGVRIIGPAGADRRVCLVAFNVEGKAASEVGLTLDEKYGILVRTGMHCAPEAHKTAHTHPDGAVRVSPGYFTTDEEIDAFIEAVREIARK